MRFLPSIKKATETSMHTILGLDIGTTSISMVIVNSENGKTLSAKTVPHNSRNTTDESDAYTQDPDKMLSIAQSLVRTEIQKFSNVGSIGVAGQMHGIVLIDGNGDAVSPVYTWLDMRTARIGYDGISHLSALQKLTGVMIPPGYGAATLYALARLGSIPDSAQTFCTVADYVAMHLAQCSEPAMTTSLAHSLGFFNMATNAFQLDLWNKITTLSPPPVVPTLTIIGHYRHNLPVIAAIGDNQAGFLASVRDLRKGIHINIGTSSQISFLAPPDSDTISPVLDTRPFPTGENLLVGAGLSGGKSFDVLAGLIKDIMGHLDLGLTINPYSILDRFINPPAGDDIPRVETMFKGTRLNPQRKGCIRDLTLRNFTIEKLYWGFSKGIVDELYQMIEHHQDILNTPDLYIVASGNAVRKNRALRLVIAQKFDSPVLFPQEKEAGARGAAMIGYAGSQGDITIIPKLSERMIQYERGNSKSR